MRGITMITIVELTTRLEAKLARSPKAGCIGVENGVRSFLGSLAAFGTKGKCYTA